MKLTKKPKIAFISLTCCEGCVFAVLDLQERFLKFVAEHVEISEFEIIEDIGWCDKIDIAFVEGNPLNQRNIEVLRDIRKRAKILVALGDCATHGCVQSIKNYQDKEKRLRYVYPDTKGIDNFEVKPIREYVTVDFEILGCPVNAEEFLGYFKELKEGRIPKTVAVSVCRECQIQGIECLLQKGEACLGPVIVGGCGATCPRANYRCEGCRGLIKDNPGLLNFVNHLGKIISSKDLNQELEKFGIRKEWEEEIVKAKLQKKKQK